MFFNEVSRSAWDDGQTSLRGIAAGLILDIDPAIMHEV